MALSEIATRAYTQAQSLSKNLGASLPSLPALSNLDSKSSFHDLVNSVKNTVQSAVDQSKEAENLSMKGIADKVDPLTVVTKVNSVHMTLQVMTTLLNKAIQAWSEIKNQPL